MNPFDTIPITSLSIMLISVSLILVVLIGGISLLFRNQKKPAAKASRSARVERPAKVDPQKTVPTALPQQGQVELGARLAELEQAISTLSRTLESTVLDHEDGAPTILARGRDRTEDLMPQIAELRASGLDANAIARRLELSDEQLELLLRVAVTKDDKAVGA